MALDPKQRIFCSAPPAYSLVLLKVTQVDYRIGMLFNILVMGTLALAMVYVALKVRGGRTSIVDAFFPIILLWFNGYGH